MSEANKEFVRRDFEENFNRKNLAVCDETMAEDFVEHAAAPFADSAPGRVRGPQAMRASVVWLQAQFPPLRRPLRTEHRLSAHALRRLPGGGGAAT